MKLIDIVNAGPALQKLIMQDIPVKKAFELAGLVTLCNPHLEFYGMEMAKIGAAHAPERVKELDDIEVAELDGRAPVQLPLDCDIRLSAADIKCLEPLVEFVPSGDGNG